MIERNVHLHARDGKLLIYRIKGSIVIEFEGKRVNILTPSPENTVVIKDSPELYDLIRESIISFPFLKHSTLNYCKLRPEIIQLLKIVS